MNIRSPLVFLAAISTSAAEKGPSMASIRKREAARVAQVQHEISEHIKKFQENLEGLRTTVDFEPITV